MSSYDAVIYFRDYTDEDFCKHRFRVNPETVVHIGILKTNTMEAKVITTNYCFIRIDFCPNRVTSVI